MHVNTTELEARQNPALVHRSGTRLSPNMEPSRGGAMIGGDNSSRRSNDGGDRSGFRASRCRPRAPVGKAQSCQLMQNPKLANLGR
ncbi:hypothetical protein ACLOJK_032287, partial [Asimina triloba]